VAEGKPAAAVTARPLSPHHRRVAGKLVFLCGQVGQDPSSGKLIGGGVRQQTQQIFANMAVLLKDLGLTLDEDAR
jgi:2-iminobutanoate/2-iminopropanoate deaminase